MKTDLFLKSCALLIFCVILIITQPVARGDDFPPEEFPFADNSAPGDPRLSGPGIDPGRGNIWFWIPIFKNLAGGRSSLDFRFRYNSIRSNIDDGCGPGFSHRYHLYAEEVRGLKGGKWILEYVDVIDGKGRPNRFKPNKNGNFETPAGFRATLAEENGHYCLKFWSGGEWIYNDVDASGRFFIDRMVSREGRTIRFVYSGPHSQLSKITDAWGNKAFLSYDSVTGYPETITHPDGNQTQLTYQDGKLVAITDPALKTRSFEYAGSRVVKDIMKNGTWFSISYGSGLRECRDSLGELVFKVTASRFPSNPLQIMHTSGIVHYEDGDVFAWTLNRDKYCRITKN